MARNYTYLITVFSLIVTGCSKPSRPTQPAVPAVAARPEHVPLPVAEQPASESLTNDNMEVPLKDLRGYSVADFKKLPNCLDVFEECVKVPFEKVTTAQYKNTVSNVAAKPCRVVLEVVDVYADGDGATFKLLSDDGSGALVRLKKAGDLGGYTEGLKNECGIRDLQKKGFNANHSIGDRVVLVGLGHIVDSSPWGAGRHSSLPRGDSRYVMLRAFGKPNSYRTYDYDFAFMVRNWYIASQ